MNKYIIKLAAVMALVLGLEEIVLIGLLPQYAFPLLPVIPVFFLIFGIVIIKLVYSNPNPSVASLMGAKMLKVLLSLGIVLAYIFLVKQNATIFLASYLIFFIAFLLFETWMLSTLFKKK